MAGLLEAWVSDGGGPGVAPQPLEVVRGLLNTDDRYHGVDRLGDGPVELVTFRDAVRTYVTTGDTDALEVLAARYPLTVTLESNADGTSHPRLTPAPGTADGLTSAVARLFVIMCETHSAGTWQRLKVCSNPECQWVFYDASRNRSGRWCAMGECGDVFKARAYRERRRVGRQDTAR
ncbi:CGNR zinc finger domain-containing protein [Cellulomonas sp. S1-8]|uniref:CGNR zinc finger domain-containing protein n=1 Tax=Cellulomonas sp. S1-8 TaxID=2904790 RepID=UPI0022439847|nr:CGNR zinc finger domain-containing protein [Cellulomonas sp. S1-8]UZN04201.1 CGNR zinc finger domain-containing protein [Cellulomonas sp. S1-8]